MENGKVARMGKPVVSWRLLLKCWRQLKTEISLKNESVALAKPLVELMTVS